MTDLVWTPIKIRLGQIRPWEANPRMSTKAQAQRLIKSERELGQIQTLAVSPFDGDFVDLYDGHQRCAAWMTVKQPSYEVTALQSNRPLSEDERRKVSVLLHTATGSWSWDALSSWSVADLREWGMDSDTLKGWNNDALNLREMMGSEEPIDYQKEWQGMPEFEQEDLSAWKSITIHFDSMDNLQNFAELVGQTLTEKTKSIWYPKKEREDLLSLVAHAES